MKVKLIRFVVALAMLCIAPFAISQNNVVHIGIDGLTHNHVHAALQTLSNPDSKVKIVGIAESDKELARKYAKVYGFDMSLVYDNVEQMIEAVKPEGVMAFNSIYGHLKTVEVCAPKGIHVMVEKPLAVSMEHARKMAKLATQHKILLLTNYETSWYASNHKIYQLVNEEQAIGGIRKAIICDGHQGPKEIGCSPDFLNWLTDPIQNGGGAVIDFGCYGANLMTWLMKNERPVSVSATLRRIKPDVYPKVDDDATIVVTYPKAQAIIQGSWNWAFSRKDMEVYGKTGYIKAPNANNILFRFDEKQQEKTETPTALAAPYNDPFNYFAAAIKGTINVKPEELASLDNNMIVVEILDAAKKSSQTGKTIYFK